ncbi:uncharacterized protein LOC105833539 isoform X1 [Monomorium pharaonis]|uniref:uncharacterized protein LOC105833539 isoform X1 n=1 Tax=Monomorium pharaonis TaxID=307658 RepID=UPI00063F5600|nr:uncharacterized protein LOC105833539 isoform X1 [Monomorium pharaonis]XP_036150008.1 uncharacterized protein LOC105833539 isoform X1 [Monomorium pharaonis]XP_036150009.1 uncharacterized protein LOC105833539 isoform X1 [Monomorium pharaonis]XP_036150010.1 uncharacterized protein LOC105833539 isoform X1 [Monomorium pharaonis]XP_036150011.1 uncharacterized protein LOC105833539 isoform X1 [Monomorium pharaonis]
MAANALEEKINKIRQQNEEIRRRHEEVEEDKKNAAKLNALVQMVPSTDWPERKEPPEFSNPPRTTKSKSVKEHHEPLQQYQSTSGEGRKVHTFAQGQGPPPDPKYNFLADAEREEGERENTKDNSNRGQKYSRGMFRKKPGAKDGMQKDYRTNRGSHRDEHQPEYEAWRAERNRIDEDRISRQRTAEGNWRREWDNDKIQLQAHIVDDVMRSEAKLGEYVKKDYKDFDRRYHVNGNDYASHNRSGHRSYRGNSRHFHNNYENSSNNAYHHDGHIKNLSNSEKRTVIATDKSIKVMLNQGNMTKGPVMSVKVNSPSIAGTGRVGPRQRSRVTYSSHSDVEVVSPDMETFTRPKSYEDRMDRTKGHENLHKSSNSRKSQLPPKKKDFSNKSPYFRKKEFRREDESMQKHQEMESLQKEPKKLQKSCQSKFQKPEENTAEPLQDEKIVTANEKESNIISSRNSDINNVIKNTDNHNDNLSSHTNEKDQVDTDKESEPILQNLDLSTSKIDTEVEMCKVEKVEDMLESSNIQAIVTFESGERINTTANLIITSSIKDDKNKTKYMELCDTDEDIKKMENKNNSEQTKETLSDNCDNKQTKEMSKQEDDIKQDTKSFLEEKEVNSVMIPSLVDVQYTIEQSDKLKSEDTLKKIEILAIKDEVAIADEKMSTGDKKDKIISINETQERTDKFENMDSVANNIIVDKIESLKDLHVEEKEAALNDQKTEK